VSNRKGLRIKHARTNLARSPRALSFYEEGNKEWLWTDYNSLIIDNHEQFVLIWKGIDSKPATCIRYMNHLFQSCSSNLGFNPCLNILLLLIHTGYMVCEIREYILPLADEIFKTLYVYQSLENLISSYINWFNNLQLLTLAVECTTYSSLTSGDRKTTYDTKSYLCDDNLNGWYRFQGAAGTRMPTSCPPMWRCGTATTGWLNGVHPTVADGKVTRQVCFHWFFNCCYRSTNIEVRNCGSFYVYHFSGTPIGCDFRYCGID